jgi:hypothetical protein
MGLFRPKPDPSAQRERELQAQIASLKGQIQQINRKMAAEQAQPKLKSTALPHTAARATPLPHQNDAPTFEPVHPPASRSPEPVEVSADQYNELGIRKYDLAAVWRRWLGAWRRKPAPNPKLVNYLAAGSIQGLRPLRYEKRIARRRFLALFAFFALLVLGLISYYLGQR